MRFGRTAAALLIALGLIGPSAPCSAEPIVISVGASAASAGGDTVTLQENQFSIPLIPAGFILQTGNFHVVDTGLDQTFPITLSRLLTVGNVQQVVSQIGLVAIRPANHMLDLFGGSTRFDLGSNGTVELTIGSSFASGEKSGDYSFTVSAGIAPTPEPSTLMLLGVALVVCGARWRNAKP